MKSKFSHIRSFHLRNLSLFHTCNAWSVMHRGYPVSDWEFYGSKHWDGFKGFGNYHVLRPKPRLKNHPIKHCFNSFQLTINFDLV